jgi:hypothetical protein
VPIRTAFVQKPPGPAVRSGPLHHFVKRGDDRGLEAYLFIHALASSAPWTCTYPSETWVRVLNLEQTCSAESAKAAVSKTLRRLEERGLLVRRRDRRSTEVTLLHEDGNGDPYTRPRSVDDGTWFTLPYGYWRLGHYRSLSLPAKAMLLIALSLTEDFTLPLERMPKWYGISSDSAGRGLRELRERDLLTTRDTYELDAKSRTGWRLVQWHALREPYDGASRSALNAGAARQRRPSDAHPFPDNVPSEAS